MKVNPRLNIIDLIRALYKGKLLMPHTFKMFTYCTSLPTRAVSKDSDVPVGTF